MCLGMEAMLANHMGPEYGRDGNREARGLFMEGGRQECPPAL